MKKIYFYLVMAFSVCQASSAIKQTSNSLARTLLTRLILLTSNAGPQPSDKEILALTDSLGNTLSGVTDQDLANEARYNISRSLLDLKNKQQAHPYYLESLLQNLNESDMAAPVHIYRRAVALGLSDLYTNFLNDGQDFPSEGYTNIRNNLNYRFYNNQPFEDGQLPALTNYIAAHPELPREEKESLLFKAAILARNDKNISAPAKNQVYQLLNNTVLEKNITNLNYFSSLKEASFLPSSATAEDRFAKIDQLNGSVFAGIEIGSSAVKLSVVKMVKDVGDYRYFKVLCEPTTKDIKSREFTPANYKTIAAKVKEFYDCLLLPEPGFHLPNYKIFITCSSGFCANFINGQHPRGLDSLDEEIKLAINDPGHVIARLDPGQEAGLTHLGLLFDPLKHNSTLVIDIGDGNTKGGFYPLGSEDFTSVDFALASGTLKSRVETIAGTTLTVPDFAQATDKYLAEHEQAEIDQVLSAINSVSNQREVYFSGGISWVISNLIKPNNPRMEPVEITRESINTLINNVTYNFAKTLDNATRDYELYRRKADGSAPSCINCQSQDFIFAKFDEKKFIAGAKVMLAVMEQLNMSTIPKKFYVATSGKLSWLNAFILKNLN